MTSVSKTVEWSEQISLLGFSCLCDILNSLVSKQACHWILTFFFLHQIVCQVSHQILDTFIISISSVL